MRIISLFFILLPAISIAQSDTTTLPFKDGKIFYEEIVQVDTSYHKDLIFNSVSQWFAETFKDSKSVIQLSDRENGKIIGKGDYSFFIKSTSLLGKMNSNVIVGFTLTADTKDSKYRIQIYDFDFAEDGSEGLGDNIYKRYDHYIKQDVKGFGSKVYNDHNNKLIEGFNNRTLEILQSIKDYVSTFKSKSDF